MVDPSWNCQGFPRLANRSGSTRTLRALLATSGAVGLLVLNGCSYVPKARLDDCHRLSQTLQAENSRLMIPPSACGRRI